MARGQHTKNNIEVCVVARGPMMMVFVRYNVTTYCGRRSLRRQMVVVIKHDRSQCARCGRANESLRGLCEGFPDPGKFHNNKLCRRVNLAVGGRYFLCCVEIHEKIQHCNAFADTWLTMYINL